MTIDIRNIGDYNVVWDKHFATWFFFFDAEGHTFIVLIIEDNLVSQLLYQSLPYLIER